MLFGDVMAIALSIVGFLLSLQGLWLVSAALWPGRVAAAAARCESSPVTSFVLGIVITGVWMLGLAVIARLGTPGQLAAFAGGFVYLMYAGVGSAGLATHVGRRLASPADVHRPWRATVRGGVALELAFLIPILGWLGLLPISFILGTGAATLGLFRRRERPVHSVGSAPAALPQAWMVPAPASHPAAVPPILPREGRPSWQSQPATAPEREPAGVAR